MPRAQSALAMTHCKECGGAGDREGRPYAKKPPLPKGRGTNRRLVEGYLRGEWLRVFCAFVRGRIPQSRLRRASPL